jgi:6-phosphogluconolactonase
MMSDGPQLDILPDSQSMAESAAAWIAEQIAATDDVFRMALSGGSTPRLLYTVLASSPFRERIEWRRVELFWGDERFVPHTDERSNYRMVRETLLAHAPVLIDHVHPIVIEADPESTARRYDALLKSNYGSEALDASHPLFDLVLLGLGGDGHTASLFPGSRVLGERTHWVAAVEDRDEPRITLTYPAIASSRAVAFLVSGEEKADMVRRVQDGDRGLPAARVDSEGGIVWFLDEAAASRLPMRSSS